MLQKMMMMSLVAGVSAAASCAGGTDAELAYDDPVGGAPQQEQQAFHGTDPAVQAPTVDRQVWFSEEDGSLIGFKEPDRLQALLERMAANETFMEAMAVTPDDEWIVVSADAVTRSAGFPTPVYNVVLHHQLHEPVRAIDFNDEGGWIVAGDTLSAGVVPEGLSTTLQEYADAGYRLLDVELTDEEGYVVIGESKDATRWPRIRMEGIVDSELREFIITHETPDGPPVRQVAVAHDKRWVVSATDAWAYGEYGLHDPQHDPAFTLQLVIIRTAREPSHIVLGTDPQSWVIYSNFPE